MAENNRIERPKVYGLKVSYFSGKLEGYLKYKEIPYDFHATTVSDFQKLLPEKTGALQMPAVELPDGRWMTDTSPIIDWFEAQHTEHPILPDDPVQAFLCRLIEDYADEWQWRPAMHYRWSYPVSSKLLARQISDAMAKDLKVPGWLVRKRTEKRQFHNFVERDGVNEKTRDHVEQGYLRLLETLNVVFTNRPFIFGDRPTLADIGLFGPLFRHYSMDPDPAIIMRETAPAVMEWVYRLWHSRASRMQGSLVSGVPDDLLPLIKEIGETHLEAQCANAEAFKAGQKQHDYTVQNITYTNIQTSRYRVWCLEQLQERYHALEEPARTTVAKLLSAEQCLEPLTRIQDSNSGYNTEGTAPFGKSLPVFEDVKN